MATRKNNTDNRIPRRVSDAAQNMAQNASSGPRRGYIPPDTGRMQQTPGMNPWQQGGQPVYYAGQNPQQAGQPGYYGQNSQQAYYVQQTGMNAGQRGFMTGPVPAMKQKPPKAKKNHNALIILALVLLAAALGTGGYFAVTNHAYQKKITDKVTAYEDKFCNGVYVDGIHLGGMKPQQAQNSVISQIQQRNDAWKVQLTYEGNQILEINADMLGYNNVDTNSVLLDAWQKGHVGTAEEKYNEMLLLEEQPYQVYTTRPEGNTGAIDAKLEKIKEAIDMPATDAQLINIDPSLIYPFIFQEDAYGRRLDIEPLKERLYQMAATMESGTLNLEPEPIAPSVTLADVMQDYKLRADVTTEIDRHSEDNRNNNIRHAFEYINGYRLDPGKTFSFNNVVGERTEARGFYEAEEYVYGEHQRGVGGGVCQAATTVYQAAVNAGLKILKRSKHSDSVSYAGYGEDATVYWSEFRGGKKIDMSFMNNTDKPIYMLAFVENIPKPKKKGNKLRTRVIIYGADLGNVTYRLEAKDVDTLPMVPSKPTNDKSKVSDGKIGHVVDSYQVQYSNGVETNRKQLAHDVYDPIPGRYYDPSASDS